MDRDQVFDEQLSAGLASPEILGSLAKAGAPSAEELRRHVRDHRLEIVRGIEEIDTNHRLASVGFDRLRQRARVVLARRIFFGTAAGIATIAAFVASSYNFDRGDALKAHREVSIGNVIGYSVATPFVAVFVGFVVFGIWTVAKRLLRPAVGETSTSADSERAGFIAALIRIGTVAQRRLRPAVPGETSASVDNQVDGGFSAALIVLTFYAFYAPHGLAEYLYDHGAISTSRGDYWYFALLGLAALYAGLFWPGPTSVDVRALQTRVEQANIAWRSALLDRAILPFLRSQINLSIDRRFSTQLAIGDADGLRDLTAASYNVRTPAAERLVQVAEGIGSGCIALCGPRGSGKTALLGAFAQGHYVDGSAPADASLVISAPVDFDRREFMLHLYSRVCELVISDKRLDDLKAAGRDQLVQIGYLKTLSSESSGSVGWRGISFAQKRGTSMSQQPLTYPEIVNSLNVLLRGITKTLAEGQRNARPRLIVGIDELDRIQPVERARDFLNELKALLGVPRCLFVLSVSDETLDVANAIVPGHRDLFDNTIDEVVRVGHLDYATSRQLLDRRIIDLPEPFGALFHVLSGGFARELLRTARAAVTFVRHAGPMQIADVAAALVRRDLARIHDQTAVALLDGVSSNDAKTMLDKLTAHADQNLASMLRQPDQNSPQWRTYKEIADRAHYLETVLSVFSDQMDRDQMLARTESSAAGSFDALASAGRLGGIRDSLARETISEIRNAWALPPIPQQGDQRDVPELHSA